MTQSIKSFPNAPTGWSPEHARQIVEIDGIELTDDHWEVISALQAYYRKVEIPKLRQVKDALNEKFYSKAGIKFLHQVIPTSPVAVNWLDWKYPRVRWINRLAVLPD